MKKNKPCRVFLDANILFSAAYGSPALKRLWNAAKEDLCILLASPYVIEEARRNLDTEEQHAALEVYLAHVQVVSEIDRGMPCPIDLPEKDRPVFTAAMMAETDYLVTGDVFHFGPFFGQIIQGVAVCRLRDLYDCITTPLK